MNLRWRKENCLEREKIIDLCILSLQYENARCIMIKNTKEEKQMASIGINIYAFSICGQGGTQLVLNNISNGKDVISLFEEYINQHLNSYEDDQSREQIYKFVDYDVVQEYDDQGSKYLKYLYGRIKTGNYGIETEIVNKTTSVITHTQNENEAGVKPFDFLIILPEDDCMETIIILQTVSRYGIKGVLEKGFQSYLKSNYGIEYIHFGSIYPREFIEKYIKDGYLKKLRLLKYGLPSDIAEQYGVTSGFRKAKKETIISNKNGFDLSLIDKIKECVRGKIGYSDVVVVDEEYDDIKLEFSLGGRPKSFSLKNLDRVVVAQDISSIVHVKGGNPVKESIVKIMREEAVEYLQEKGFIVPIESVKRQIISSAAGKGEKYGNDEEFDR